MNDSDLGRETVHMCPPGDGDRTPCCGRSVMQMALARVRERITTNPDLVTCKGAGSPPPTRYGLVIKLPDWIAHRLPRRWRRAYFRHRARLLIRRMDRARQVDS